MKRNLVLILLIICCKSFALVKPNSLFSNNMVLQRGVEVPIWGTANEGEKVTVEFNRQKVSTIAKEGKWMVKLKPLQASDLPAIMTISGENVIRIENVLVGEVWICSGQSNMEMTLSSAWPKPITNWKAEAKAANYPEIRQCFIPKMASDTLVSDAKATWSVCDTVSVKKFTAVGYFFAMNLFKSMKVPIGIIFTSWGGTTAEYWTPSEAINAIPELQGVVENYNKAVNEFPATLEKYNSKKKMVMEKWIKDSLAASANHQLMPAKPTKPSEPKKPIGVAGSLYNAMINPIIPFAVKGVVWYQGESNRAHPKQYQFLFPSLINTWRKNWGNLNLPFLFVQIAPYKEINPELREAQLLTLNKVPNTAMVVTTDCGDSTTIHPPLKQPVGFRLSLAARALAYKEKIEYMGPIYKAFEVKDNTIEISFTHIGKGLMSRNGELTGFVIAGIDKNFHPAKATIKGDKIIVS